MRNISGLSLVLAGFALAACGTVNGQSRYQSDLDRLSTDCEDRGGILTPTGAETGRPETDYACKITGGATRIPPR